MYSYTLYAVALNANYDDCNPDGMRDRRCAVRFSPGLGRVQRVGVDVGGWMGGDSLVRVQSATTGGEFLYVLTVCTTEKSRHRTVSSSLSKVTVVAGDSFECFFASREDKNTQSFYIIHIHHSLYSVCAVIASIITYCTCIAS